MKISRTLLAIGVAIAVIASSLGVFMTAAADPTPVTLDELELMTGTTDKFGGGDYVALNIRDARFAVHYGTEDDPNGIIISSEITRYIGGADMYRENGELVRSGAMPVRTALAQDLKYMVEFEDNENHSLLAEPPEPTGDPSLLPPPPRPVPVKGLSLNLSWAISDIVEGVDDNGNRTWDFSLSAYDISYDRVWDNGTARPATEDDGIVEEITFTFHITASEISFDVQVPWMEIRMVEQKGRMGGPRMSGPGMAQTMETKQIGNRSFNGTTITTDVKYDHYIRGWDFDSYDNILALETHTMMGNGWHEGAPEQIRERYQHRVGEGTHMRMENGTGEIKTDFSEPMQSRMVHRNQIDFEDDWQRVGRFSWIEDVEITNDGITTTETMRFQAHGGEKVIRQGFDGKVYDGFRLNAAFLYPAGEEIFHDPGLTTDVLFMDIGSTTEAFTPSVILLQVTIAAIAVVGVVGYRMYTKTGKSGDE